MPSTLTFAAVLLAVTALADAGSGLLKVPQSIVLVLTRAALSFVPGMRPVAVEPDFVLLQPLLYGAGLWHELARLPPQYAPDPASRHRHRVTNSAAYDAALHQRGSLTVWFTAAIAAWKAERRSTRGGQSLYSGLAIATALLAFQQNVFQAPSRIIVTSDLV